LVGKVTQTSFGFSKVSLSTNSSFSTTAQDLSTGAMGVAKGQGGGEIVLDNVVSSQELTIGDLVVTKGEIDINGIGILPNLVLGKITSINKNPSSLFQIAKLKTLVDFSDLSKVFIIKN
jgi:cell shape-determining protein MreC